MQPHKTPSSNATLPTVITKRPLLMFTGFLGAGKTTLLRSILDDLAERGHLADVILNDRENALIDQSTLEDHAASVAALTGSCVCCEGMDEMYDMILETAKQPHQILMIELSGTSDPLPILESFTLLESKFLLQPRWQVCVIDSRHFGKERRNQGLERLQLETASHYYISHTDKLTREQAQSLQQAITSVNPHATRVTPAELGVALSQAIEQNSSYAIAQAEASIEQAKDSKKKQHFHDRHELAHEFTGCNIVFPDTLDAAKVEPWLKALPDTVIRAKALIAHTPDPSVRYLYERVGKHITSRALPARSIHHAPCSGIFIGPNLQPDEILSLTSNLLHTDCHFSKK